MLAKDSLSTLPILKTALSKGGPAARQKRRVKVSPILKTRRQIMPSSVIKPYYQYISSENMMLAKDILSSLPIFENSAI